MYVKKILKNDNSIKKDKIIICKFSFTIFERSFVGKNPPEDISVKAKFREFKNKDGKLTFDDFDIQFFSNLFNA